MLSSRMGYEMRSSHPFGAYGQLGWTCPKTYVGPSEFPCQLAFLDGVTSGASPQFANDCAPLGLYAYSAPMGFALGTPLGLYTFRDG